MRAILGLVIEKERFDTVSVLCGEVSTILALENQFASISHQTTYHSYVNSVIENLRAVSTMSDIQAGTCLP
jgi:hypothetical protein